MVGAAGNGPVLLPETVKSNRGVHERSGNGIAMTTWKIPAEVDAVFLTLDWQLSLGFY